MWIRIRISENKCNKYHVAFLYNFSGKKQDNYCNVDHDDDMAQFHIYISTLVTLTTRTYK